MISIIYNSINLCYIYWILTESGPVIVDYELVDNQNDKFFKNLNNNILNKVNDEESLFSFSIDSQSLLYNQSENVYGKDVRYSNWINDEIALNNLKTQYKIYSYPFNDNKLFNIYYPEDINRNIFEYVQSKNGSIKSISPGIFAAESACRFWYKSKISKIKNYLVWRSDSKSDQVLLIENNQFKALINFKTFKTKIKILQSIGNEEDILNIKRNIEMCLYGSKKITEIDYIFIYQINKSNNKLKYLLNKNNIKNICLLSPFELFESINKPSKNKYILSCFAECGNSFGEIDV